MLINVPYVSKSWMWEQETENYAMLVRSRLAEFGMDGLEQADVTITYTLVSLLLRSLLSYIGIEKIEKREGRLRRYIRRGTFALAWEEQA